VAKIKPLFKLAALVVLFAASSCATAPRLASVKPAVFGKIEYVVPEWRKLYPGLDFIAGRIERPRLEFWAIRADLTDSRVEVAVNDGIDESARTIQSVTVSGFAAKYGCAAAMNAGPFSPVSSKTGEARTLTGVFISGGVVASPPDPRYDSLLFYEDGRAAVLPQRKLSDFNDVRHAVGGFYAILKDGFLTERVVANASRRHPRSAAGINGGWLYLLVIDGRRFGSAGATEQETALLLRALGALDGILMDGGGSTALALYADGTVKLANRPIHGGIVGRERAVATCIGIRYKKQPLP
jgi:hypothetical protein